MFLKGCSLRCKWCSNPESIKPYPEVGVYEARCIGLEKCGYCMEVCSGAEEGLFSVEQGKVTAIDRRRCRHCLSCADVCPANALIVWGKRYTAPQVVEEVMADIDFYRKSGGGVTLSGGEPLVQWKFTLEILKRCKERGIHTCLETTHHASPDILKMVYPYVDMIITDIKHMDRREHRKYTGVDNDLILANIVETARRELPLLVRIPVIPGLNDVPSNIEATSRFLTDNLKGRVLQVQLLPYRQLGLEKYRSLGLPYEMGDEYNLDRESRENNIRELAEVFHKLGVPAVAGSSSKL